MRRPIGLMGWLRGYRVEWRWKEEVIYWKWTTPFTRRGYVFDGGWGATPPVTYLPTDAGYEPGQGHRLLDRRQGRPPP